MSYVCGAHVTWLARPLIVYIVASCSLRLCLACRGGARSAARPRSSPAAGRPGQEQRAGLLDVGTPEPEKETAARVGCLAAQGLPQALTCCSCATLSLTFSA
eukprot:13729451-Heterocapsa_arctica.AAC.1